jgi:tetratricopeptide (TPR) repeat protein
LDLALVIIVLIVIGAAVAYYGSYDLVASRRVPLPPEPSREELAARAIGNLLHGLKYAIEDEDFMRARDAFDAVDRSFLREDEIAMLEAGLAWCELNLGHTEKAIELAKDAVHDAPASVGRSRGCALAILGAIQVRAGQPHSAVQLLREAVAIDPRAEHKAFAGFFLGEALAATGAPDDARAALEAAAAACTDSRYAHLARERVATLAVATPYR